jgi:hypothetical protein
MQFSLHAAPKLAAAGVYPMIVPRAAQKPKYLFTSFGMGTG